MAEPPIKTRLESKELTNNPVSVQGKLDACLAFDPAHIEPGDKGEHVKTIQSALNKIRLKNPDIAMVEIKDPPGEWKQDTTNAVFRYKSFFKIKREGQELDPIVGRMTITQIDQDLLSPGPSPKPPPSPTTDDISIVSADIKKELAGDDDFDLEFLARLYESDRIADSGTAGDLPNRLMTILAASADAGNNGVTHFSGIFVGLRDRGFRTAFKDPFPGKSDNQVGHFTTAVDMGFRPLRTFALLPSVVQDLRAPVPPLGVEETFCVRLIIGHEQVADDATLAFLRQARSPTTGEIEIFGNALAAVTSARNQAVGVSRAALSGIRIGTGQGNSIQDLHLSLFGFKFGKMIRSGTISNRADAAMWIRTNVGTFLPNPIPPGPPTG
jgi:hypothetical protein